MFVTRACGLDACCEDASSPSLPRLLPAGAEAPMPLAEDCDSRHCRTQSLAQAHCDEEVSTAACRRICGDKTSAASGGFVFVAGVVIATAAPFGLEGATEATWLTFADFRTASEVNASEAELALLAEATGFCDALLFGASPAHEKNFSTMEGSSRLATLPSLLTLLCVASMLALCAALSLAAALAAVAASAETRKEPRGSEAERAHGGRLSAAATRCGRAWAAGTGGAKTTARRLSPWRSRRSPAPQAEMLVSRQRSGGAQQRARSPSSNIHSLLPNGPPRFLRQRALLAPARSVESPRRL
eukprot:1866103-Pleurochrysis_carterae.AAC.2